MRIRGYYIAVMRYRSTKQIRRHPHLPCHLFVCFSRSTFGPLRPRPNSPLPGHQAVLEDPEVVLTLASWGFCAHSDIEEDFTSPPPPPQVEAIGGSAAVSDISDEAFGGDGGCGGGGGNEIFGGRAGDSGPGSAAAATSVLLGPSKV